MHNVTAEKLNAWNVYTKHYKLNLETLRPYYVNNGRFLYLHVGYRIASKVASIWTYKY